MALSYGPKHGLLINALLGDIDDVSLRALLRAIDQRLLLQVKSRTLTAPPGSPANGDAYIVAAGGSGAWNGHDNTVAVWTTDNPATPGGLWEFHVPNAGWLTYSIADTGFYSYSGSAWGALSGGGGSSTLAGDTDVLIAAPADGQVLAYNGASSKWKNQTPSGGGGGSSTLAGDTDVLIATPADGQVLAYDGASSKWKNQTPSGGGGGVPSGTPVMHMGNDYPVALGPLGGGQTMVLKMPGRSLHCLPASWKVRIQRGSGSHFSAIKVLRTLIDSLAVVDSTAVTFGSSATPTMAAGLNLSDPIALPLDANHDYWIMGYNDSGDSSFWGMKPCQNPGAGGAAIIGGYLAGDQTAVTTLSGSISTGFGCPWDAVLAA